jgi:hypothetical protein
VLVLAGVVVVRAGERTVATAPAAIP